MNTLNKLSRTLLVISVYIVLTCSPAWASYCKVVLADEKPKSSLADFPEIKKGLKEMGSTSDSVKRVGSPYKSVNQSEYTSAGEGVWEVKVDLVNFLHPIPNPARYPKPNPENYELELAQAIRRDGFILGPKLQDGSPINVAIMPDGKLYCIGGNHRLYAMELLGQEYIPAKVFIWSKLNAMEKSIFTDYLVD